MLCKLKYLRFLLFQHFESLCPRSFTYIWMTVIYNILNNSHFLGTRDAYLNVPAHWIYCFKLVPYI